LRLHQIEAAAAHNIATGSDQLLNIALRYADLIDRTFGRKRTSSRLSRSRVIERAGQAYKLTRKAYLNLAKYFIDQRGQSPLYFPEEEKRYGNKRSTGEDVHDITDYQGEAVPGSHVARAMRCAPCTCIRAGGWARETEDRDCGTFASVLGKRDPRQMYVTARSGRARSANRSRSDYDLPNDTVTRDLRAAGAVLLLAALLQKD
jgi:DUF1680 family protein